MFLIIFLIFFLLDSVGLDKRVKGQCPLREFEGGALKVLMS